MSVFEELTSVPIDQLINSVGRGIAKAQFDLDMAGVRIAQLMSGMDKKNRVMFGGKEYSLLELGFTPTFYQFVETVIEVKVSISITNSVESTSTSTNTTEETETDDGGWFSSESSTTTNTSSVSASYASKYQYSAEGSSMVRTRLVPVPAPALLNERIRALVAQG